MVLKHCECMRGPASFGIALRIRMFALFGLQLQYLGEPNIRHFALEPLPYILVVYSTGQTREDLKALYASKAFYPACSNFPHIRVDWVTGLLPI